MDQQFIQWIIGQVGLGGVAALALYLLNQNYKASLAAAQQHYSESESDKKILMTTLTDNTRAITQLTVLIERMGNDRSNARTQP